MDHGRQAEILRQDLRRAGVTREELFTSTKTSKRMGFHDLRATGLTWMAVRGDNAFKIEQRGGHRNPSTTRLYVCIAEAVRDGFGEVFPVLPGRLMGKNSIAHEVSKRPKIYRISREICPLL